jgi:hypothetical protein
MYKVEVQLLSYVGDLQLLEKPRILILVPSESPQSLDQNRLLSYSIHY